MRIIIVENYPLACEGLKCVFDQDEDTEVIGVASDGDQAVKLAKKLSPDVVLLILHTDCIDGAEVIHKIKRSDSNIKILVVTTIMNPQHLKSIVNAQPEAVLSADSQVVVVKNALRSIYNNLTVMDEDILKKAKDAEEFPGIKLTKRERCFVHAIIEGKTNKEIAAENGLKEGTVKNAVSRILNKTGTSSRAQLVYVALKYFQDFGV